MTTDQLEIVATQAVEILSPSKYEKRRLELKAEYEKVLVEAVKITAIDTHEQVENATNIGRLLKTAEKETAEFFKEVKQKIDAIKKPVLDAEKVDCGAYENEATRIGSLHLAYNKKVQQEKEAADRIEAEKERTRLIEEQIMRAVEMEAIGDAEAAEQVLAEPVRVVHVSTVAAPKMAGTTDRNTYKAKVTSLTELVKAIAEGKAPLSAVEPNMVFLNGQARSFKKAFAMPGVALDEQENMHYRR